MATPAISASIIVKNPEHRKTTLNVARLEGFQVVAPKAKLPNGWGVERDRAVPGRATSQSSIKETAEQT
jgi:hypothetical protein